ncbi:hypothetical protein F4781DRAFT_382144 [Annulohypoxylon bovei var. microspora]|nr:hypothetical protein F4781DRAFT_382144 [Annulohypoxylon bovei var. microspora]
MSARESVPPPPYVAERPAPVARPAGSPPRVVGLHAPVMGPGGIPPQVAGPVVNAAGPGGFPPRMAGSFPPVAGPGGLHPHMAGPLGPPPQGPPPPPRLAVGGGSHHSSRYSRHGVPAGQFGYHADRHTTGAMAAHGIVFNIERIGSITYNHYESNAIGRVPSVAPGSNTPSIATRAVGAWVERVAEAMPYGMPHRNPTPPPRPR